jgi:hypothetical protein
MPSIRFKARFDTSHHGQPYTFKEAGIVENNLTETDIYRNPTATDITLNNNSCHSGERKMAILKTG